MGETVSALYAGHRDSLHTTDLTDLTDRYAEILAAIEASDGWVTSVRSSSPPLTILGSLDGIEAGLRQPGERHGLSGEVAGAPTSPAPMAPAMVSRSDSVHDASGPGRLRCRRSTWAGRARCGCPRLPRRCGSFLVVQRNQTRDCPTPPRATAARQPG